MGSNIDYFITFQKPPGENRRKKAEINVAVADQGSAEEPGQQTDKGNGQHSGKFIMGPSENGTRYLNKGQWDEKNVSGKKEAFTEGKIAKPYGKPLRNGPVIFIYIV